MLALAAVVAVYLPGLDGPLVLDDEANLEPFRTFERGAIEFAEIFTGDLVAASRTRPLAMLTFGANWLITGDDVWHLKFTNLVLHLICGALVFWLTGSLLGRPVAGGLRHRWWIAAWTAAAWMLAPLLVSTVLYVVQRMAQLAALFVLCGLGCFVAGRERVEGGRPRSGIVLVIVTFVVFWPLATASKPNGALLPLLALAVELFFFAGARARVMGLRIVSILALLAAAPAVVFAVRVATSPQWLLQGYAARAFGPYERVITQGRVLLDYAMNALMLPGATPLGLFRDDYPHSIGLTSPPATVLAIAFWAVLLSAAWFVRGTRAGVLLFGAVFFLCAHAVESSVLPLEIYFEHRNYLPSVGLFMSVGFGGAWLASTLSGRHRTAVVALLVAACLSYAGGTFQRVQAWQSRERLLSEEARLHPASRRVHTELVNAALLELDLEGALLHLGRADRLDDTRALLGTAAHYLAAYCVVARAPPDSAYVRLADPARRSDDPYTETVLRWLTERIEAGGCPTIDVPRASVTLSEAVARTEPLPGRAGYQAVAHLYAARWLAQSGTLTEALPHLETAARLLPSWVEPGLLETRYRIELGDLAGARHALGEVKARAPDALRLYREMITEYERLLAPSDP